MKKDYSQAGDIELYAMLGEDRKVARQAFGVIYDRHVTRVYSYCRRILNNPVLAEDMVQEAFARMYEQAQKKVPMSNLPAFLVRVARNLCLNEKEKKEYGNISLEEFHLGSVDNTFERGELMKMIEAALETLPEDMREVFCLKEFDGLPYSEIAQILSISEQNVRIRIFRAKQKLREILAPYLNDSI